MAIIIVTDSFNENLISLAENSNAKMYFYTVNDPTSCFAEIQKNISREEEFLENLGIPNTLNGFKYLKLFLKEPGTLICSYTPIKTMSKYFNIPYEKLLCVFLSAKASVFSNETDLSHKIFSTSIDINLSLEEFALRILIYYSRCID